MWEDGGETRPAAAGGGRLDALFHELMHECKHSAPGARLSARLRAQLERLRPETRRAVVSRTAGGSAPLLVAARRGNGEAVEYLVHVCCAELEQRGACPAPDARATHRATPLWCAAVAGHLEVVRILADAGADVNAASDSGSTPVRSACFMSAEAVVRELVARGADVGRASHAAGTPLINAVHAPALAALLLAHGAPVDAQDLLGCTALHYAIQEHRMETARLLLDAGADPLLRSRAGDDALQTAALKGAAALVSLLVSRGTYGAGRTADAYELLGASMLDEFNDPAAARAAWAQATALRHQGGRYIPKRALSDEAAAGARRALGAAGAGGEWATAAELAAAGGRAGGLHAAALLVAARVLGPPHRDTLARIMHRGVWYVEAREWERAARLWTWALEIRLDVDSLLHADACQTACALTRLLLEAARDGAGGGWVHAAAARACALVAGGAGAAAAALLPAPRHRRHADAFDRVLRAITHLLYLLDLTAGSEAERAATARAARAAAAADPRSALTGDSLLHLAASRLNVLASPYFADDTHHTAIFPSARVARLLAAAGGDPRARNLARSTPLHVAAIPYNFSNELFETLLAGGAHLDTPNAFGDAAGALAALSPACRVRPLRHTSLACLAARALLAAPAPARTPAAAPRLPRELRDFLDLHRA